MRPPAAPKIMLVFCGSQVVPDRITLSLGVQPIKTLTVGGTGFYAWNGKPFVSRVGLWEYSLSESEDANGLEESVDAWIDWLSDRKNQLEELQKDDYKPYLDINVDAVKDNLSLFLYPETLSELSTLGVSLSIDANPRFADSAEVSTPDEPLEFYGPMFQLEIPSPKGYLSKGDEATFFRALKSIEAIDKTDHSNDSIVLYLSSSQMDDKSLSDLVALLTRYKVPMSMLRSQSCERNKRWFEREEKFWYQGIFGDPE